MVTTPALRRVLPGRRLLVAAVAFLALVSSVALKTTAEAAVGSDDLRAGQVYRGDFADPSVMRVGSKYFAFATTTGGKYLPALTSTDLRTWRARYSATGKWWQNDAMPDPPRWGAKHRTRNGKWRVSTWAPSVKAVQGGYVAAYSAQKSLNPVRMCVTLAYAERPLGPFVDRSSRPFVCGRDQGSIDPYVYKDAAGDPWLLWKNEGIRRREPTRIWVRKLNRTATAFAPRSIARNLLTTAQAWEGNVIENPAMVTYAGRTYLLYSANRYSTAQYAIGFAVCEGPAGPCRRPGSGPLLASGGRVDGPGGPDPFFDRDGRLRMAYAAWDRGRVGYPKSKACKKTARGCNQRKLHTATLAVLADGRLVVSDRG